MQLEELHFPVNTDDGLFCNASLHNPLQRNTHTRPCVPLSPWPGCDIRHLPRGGHIRSDDSLISHHSPHVTLITLIITGDNQQTDQLIRKYGQTLFSLAFVFGEPCCSFISWKCWNREYIKMNAWKHLQSQEVKINKEVWINFDPIMLSVTGRCWTLS